MKLTKWFRREQILYGQCPSLLPRNGASLRNLHRTSSPQGDDRNDGDTINTCFIVNTRRLNT